MNTCVHPFSMAAFSEEDVVTASVFFLNCVDELDDHKCESDSDISLETATAVVYE